MYKSDPFQDQRLKEAIKSAVIFAGIFYGIAYLTFASTGQWFYIFNFGYIGTSLFIGNLLGGWLPKKHIQWARRTTQFLIGCYMLGFLGFLAKENMQIEGFFILLLSGVFAGAVMHYLIAKIAGPLVFGRAWCGWACWTAMILDLLPWKRVPQGRLKYFGLLRYVHFFIVAGMIFYIAFILHQLPKYSTPPQQFLWLLTGNFFYYLFAVSLAYFLKDNRAFCKYLCPIPVFQKIGSRFALMKPEIDPAKCSDCKACERACPMNIKLLEYKNHSQRVLSTECILCNNCADACPKEAIRTTFKMDLGGKEHLTYQKGE